MRRILSWLLLFTLLLMPVTSGAEGAFRGRNASEFFDELFGDEAHDVAPEPTPVPEPEATPDPEAYAEFLFGDLFSNRTPEPKTESTPEPDATAMPEPEPEESFELENPFEPEEPFEPEDDARASGSLFDEAVSLITSSAWGGRVDFAHVAGWTISRGFFEGRYCLTGISPIGERVVLSGIDPVSFVPAGDTVVYFGEGTKGKYGWMALVPGERMPMELPLDAADEVFYADDQYIWYYRAGADNDTLRRMDHDGSHKKKLGTLKGKVVTITTGGDVVVVNFKKNRVQLWRNDRYETIYDPKEEIVSVVASDRHIWVEHDGEFGLLEDGEVRFRLSGRIAGTAGSSDQFAMLVLPYETADFFDIYLFNEIYRAYAPVGRGRRSDDTSIEFMQDQLIAWGPEESTRFDYPIPELWLPYGYHDFASAQNLLSDEGWWQLLIGSWCTQSTVGAGYGERLIFTPDDLYRLPAQQGKGKLKPITSTWYVSDGLLLNYVDRDTPRMLWLSGPFSVAPEEAPYSPRIAIDGVTYYQYSNDPAYFDDLKDYGIVIESSIGSPKTN